MNVRWKPPVVWNNSQQAPSWRFYIHCGCEETGSPGIMCIVCHQVFRHPSEHWTSKTGKHLLPNAHIAKLNKLTESEVAKLTSSTDDEPALPILTSQGSQGIRIVCSHSQIRFDIQCIPYWPKWQTMRSKLVAIDFEISKFHQDMRNHYLLLGFVSAHIPWNAISNPELQWSYTPLHDDLMLPLAMSITNIFRRHYALTVDIISKQLPSRNTVSLALDGSTSRNKVAIMLVIAYYTIEIEHNMRCDSLSMRLIYNSLLLSKASQEWQVRIEHAGEKLAIHLKDVLDCFDLANGSLLGITTDNASWNYSLTLEL